MVNPIAFAVQRLEQAGIEDAAFDAMQLAKLVAGGTLPTQERPLTPQQEQQLAQLCERRARHEPLQYLCGEWDFYDLTLKVGPGVLIPRPDTEIVAQAAIDAAKPFGAGVRVLDLCSGSGAIALCAAKHVPGARVTALELSPQAVSYLKQNNAAYGSPLTVVQADVLEWQTQCTPESFEVIVSNPPYISQEEMQTLAPELSYEPRMALTAPQDGLAFYRHIAPAYFHALVPGGALIFEIGWKQAQPVMEICRAAGYAKVSMERDWGGNPRCVKARRPIAF